jgi:glutamyl-tRNA synthetase
MSTVRVRFAPSPTGTPHIGNLRTALFDWLFARHTGGAFVLRIEDTDRDRYVPESVDRIMESLRWLGLEWDEGADKGGPYGPYVQSERLAEYTHVAEELIGKGHAYRCYCSPERLAAVRAAQQARKEPPRYDRHCLNLSAAERAAHEAAGDRYVVRFRMPDAGETAFDDPVYGHITFQNATQDDYVMLKSDGYPTYHLAATVDDHLMQISHVLRGDEWISSTPKHLLLYAAMGWQPPVIVHLPVIQGPDRAKLSKRHGATSVFEYRDAGFLPEAVVNFLALLGWAYDDQTEIFNREELVRHFSLEGISKNPAIFNTEKLEWMNGVYIRALPLAKLADRLLPFLDAGLPPAVPRPLDRGYLMRILPLIQERLKRLGEGPALVDFFFLDRLDYDPALLVPKGLDAAQTRAALATALGRLRDAVAFTAETLEAVLRPLAEALGLKTGQLFGTLRVATTGRTVAPPLFQTMEVLGRARSLARVEDALDRLGGSLG